MAKRSTGSSLKALPRGRPSAKAVRPSVADLVAEAPCELTVPIVFMILARRICPSFKAYPHRSDPERWFFQFHSRAVLEIDADGCARWIAGSPQKQPDIAALLDCAQARQTAIRSASTDSFAQGSQPPKLPPDSAAS